MGKSGWYFLNYEIYQKVLHFPDKKKQKYRNSISECQDKMDFKLYLQVNKIAMSL